MKSKLLPVLIFLLSFVSVVQAQDIIIGTNGDEVQAKVTEVNLDDVKYKKFSNLSGPTYVISKADIFMIKYEDGSKDVFEKNTTTGSISIRHITTMNSGTTHTQEEPEQEKPKVLPETTQSTSKPSSRPVASKPVSGSAASKPSSESIAPAPAFDPAPTDPKEQYQLGLKYEKGDGVPKDNQKAADWYSKSAEQGYAEAQYNLGVLCVTADRLAITTKEEFQMKNGQFVNANGLPIKQATAVYWWKKAAAQGHAGAKAKLKEIEAK